MPRPPQRPRRWPHRVVGCRVPPRQRPAVDGAHWAGAPRHAARGLGLSLRLRLLPAVPAASHGRQRRPKSWSFGS